MGIRELTAGIGVVATLALLGILFMVAQELGTLNEQI
jgi:hypothetical protein